MAESFGADLAAGLAAKLLSFVANEVIQAWKLDENLDTLRKRFDLIGALLRDAYAKKITTSTVEKWFYQLQDVANDTEALLDELAYQVTRRNVKNSIIPPEYHLIHRWKVARKIKSIHASFDEIFKWAGDIGLHAAQHINLTDQPRDIRIKPPCEETTLIVGRDKDISNLVEIVCKDNGQDLHVLAIKGMGGQGKTTLASMVFNSDDVSKIFTKRMWVTVSDDFDFINILNEMVESLTSAQSGLKNSQGLVNKIQESLKREKFLLVLDDVWNEDPEKWDNLRKSLLGVRGAKGSSVIVTTRKQEVIDTMQNCFCYELEKLQEDDSYKLFKKMAFPDGGAPEIEPYANLGRSMVKKCNGLPLAIKALGRLLYSKKSEQEWREILNSEIWKSKDVLPSLRLSYDNLPYSSLKRCFVYCSIIPKDSRIYKDELIQVWMALGFLLPPSGSSSLMEDIGKDYFNILLWHSLLQDIERDEFGNIQSCKMHDLVHDLAAGLSKQHSVTMTYVSRATYLRLDRNSTSLKRDLEKVRLLYAWNSVFGDVLPYLAHLTVLVLTNDGLIYEYAGELPKSLRNMKYIKHLDISYLRCKVPSYITEFYNLQTLRVWDLKEFPKKFCNLINLRHLYIKNPFYHTSCLLNRIERLTCLQTLPYYVVNKDKKCLIGQLEGLHNLRGKVKLYGLCDVANRQEASKAKLCTKSNIQSLLLNWDPGYDERVKNSEVECVIDGLEPHTDLKELTIEYFMGKRLPSWITKMTNLVNIKLSHCERYEELPSLGHLPQLRELEIEGMHNVRIIGSNYRVAGEVKTMYPSLIKLVLRYLANLEELLEPDTSTVNEDQVFPKLEVLEIVWCSKLRTMPDSCFSSLKSLEIYDLDCSKMRVEAVTTKVSSVFEDLFINNCQSLKELKLTHCRGLTRLTVGVAIEKLTVRGCPDLASINTVEETCCLRYLWIDSCPSLSEFSQSVCSTIEILDVDEIPRGFSSSVISFPNLIKLTLSGFGNVKSTLEFDDHLVSIFLALTCLIIIGWKVLKAVPDTIAKLPSLKELYIWSCGDLESLPMFDESHCIRRLRISRCPSMEERCKKESEPEWYKIQHIPIVDIW